MVERNAIELMNIRELLPRQTDGPEAVADAPEALVWLNEAIWIAWLQVVVLYR